MESSWSIELLPPEIQSLIMCHIPGISTLHSLLCASSHFYQVFKDRRDYYLTRLAVQHAFMPRDAWDLIRASRISVSLPPSAEDISVFLQSLQKHDSFQVPILPSIISIPIIRLRACIEWSIPDVARECLSNLTRLGELYTIRQDPDALNRPPTYIESQRIARAFYRFETYRYLFPPQDHFSYNGVVEVPQQAYKFLNSYELDEIEEIACIRDYMVRRLWGVFDLIEDEFVQGGSQGQCQTADEASADENWFGQQRKEMQQSYMEKMMSLGLPFLREVFTADSARLADLVISNSVRVSGYLTDCFKKIGREALSEPRAHVNRSEYLRHHKIRFREDLGECSIGWHWSQIWLSFEPGSSTMKGCRDFGYVFWERWRMNALGLLDDS